MDSILSSRHLNVSCNEKKCMEEFNYPSDRLKAPSSPSSHLLASFHSSFPPSPSLHLISFHVCVARPPSPPSAFEFRARCCRRRPWHHGREENGITSLSGTLFPPLCKQVVMSPKSGRPRASERERRFMRQRGRAGPRLTNSIPPVKEDCKYI